MCSSQTCIYCKRNIYYLYLHSEITVLTWYHPTINTKINQYTKINLHKVTLFLCLPQYMLKKQNTKATHGFWSTRKIYIYILKLRSLQYIHHVLATLQKVVHFKNTGNIIPIILTHRVALKTDLDTQLNTYKQKNG